MKKMQIGTKKSSKVLVPCFLFREKHLGEKSIPKQITGIQLSDLQKKKDAEENRKTASNIQIH